MKDEGAENDLVDRIASDPAFRLTRQEIEEVLDPARHIGRAPEQVDAFLAEAVEPVLARYGVELEAPEPKVDVNGRRNRPPAPRGAGQGPGDVDDAAPPAHGGDGPDQRVRRGAAA